MIWYEALGIMMGALIVLLVLGVPVAFTFLAVNILGAILFLRGEPGLLQLTRAIADSVSKIELAPIPLFILIGELMFRSNMAERAIDAVDRLISRVPGRLAIVTVAGGTIFSALSGSTIATTAMLGKTMLPDMLKRGYKPTMAMGPIIAIGGVDMLIPPSALTVLLATLASGMSTARIPVADLLIAGIVPGVLLSVMFVAYIIIRCSIDRSLAPTQAEVSYSLGLRLLPSVKYVLPLFIIIVVVIGSMFAGIASPTDAAALGCVATALVALCYRSLSLRVVMQSLIETALITIMVVFIIGTSVTFAQIMSLTGATEGALGQISAMNLGRTELLVFMILILLVLGCFVDQVSMMLLTLPFFMPLVAQFQIDPVWFGCLFLISMQIGLLTPPFGRLLFVMQGVAPPETKMATIAAAAMPYVAMMLLVLVLVFLFPALATWMPSLVAR